MKKFVIKLIISTLPVTATNAAFSNVTIQQQTPQTEKQEIVVTKEIKEQIADADDEDVTITKKNDLWIIDEEDLVSDTQTSKINTLSETTASVQDTDSESTEIKQPETNSAPAASPLTEEISSPAVIITVEETSTPAVNIKTEETTPVASAITEEVTAPEVSITTEETATPVVSAKVEEPAPVVSMKIEESTVPVTSPVKENDTVSKVSVTEKSTAKISTDIEITSTVKTDESAKPAKTYYYLAYDADELSAQEKTFSGDTDDIKDQLRELFYGWDSLTIDTINIIEEDDTLEISIIPQEFIIAGQDVAEYMPAGMLFFYDDRLEYDFRMYKDNIFVPIDGIYYNEEAFLYKIATAASNPASFISREDPDFYVERFNEINDSIEELNYTDYQLKQRVTTLETEVEELQTQVAELQIEVSDLTTGLTELTATVTAMQVTNADMADVIATLQYAVMTLHNTGLFGKIYPVDKDFMDKIIALKDESPDLTYDEIVELLKAEEYDYSKGDLKIILSVIYNEFD